MNRRNILLWGTLALCLLSFSGCGYYFPHVFKGPPRVVYMGTWKNRTDKLSLDMKIYQSLSRWFQKVQGVDLTKTRDGADYSFTGEILSVDLPSLAWSTTSSTTDAKVRLIVRYTLKDLKTNKVIWSINNRVYTSDFTVQSNLINTDEDAIDTIIEDMSENIYLGILRQIRKNESQTAH